MFFRRTAVAVAATVLATGAIIAGPTVSSADTTPASLPFAQDWSNPALVTLNNDWSGVASIVGYRGDGLVASADVDPRTVTADGVSTPVNVLAQSSATNSTGGIHEIEAAGAVALQGSGTADAPHLVIRVDATGLAGITVDHDLVDLDADNGGAQQFALQYRVGGTGLYTSVASGYVADASGALGDVIHVASVLPAAASGQPIVDIRILTTDTTGSDSMTGIDNITISSGGTEPPDPDPEPEPDPLATTIPAIQGTGPATPLAGELVTVDAVVTSLFTRADVLDGYFVQDVAGDADPATSDALFVFCRGFCPPLVAGDKVEVTGTAAEFAGMTQISANTADGTAIASSGNPLPVPVSVDLPATGSTLDAATFEATEGMIVRIPQTLAVSEYFQMARYGEVVLTEATRPYQFTHVSGPSVDGYAAFLDDLETRRIILDDDNSDNNDAVTGPADEPYPYAPDGLSTTNRFRGGDTIAGLTGVLHWSWSGSAGTDAWRVRPVTGNDYTFTSTNPVGSAPDVGGSLRVASFNVLNYFTTIDETASGSTGPCGPSGGQDCRGADSAAELDQQRAKIVSALTAIDADVVGLIEIQNDTGESTDDLVAALDAATAPGTYAAVDTGTIGTDAIKVALIYRPRAVTPVGDFAILDSSVDPAFIDSANRPALIQSFEQVGTGERFTVAVNHLKSKGSPCDGDPDVGDGQANCNLTRTDAAGALASYLATDPTGSGDPDVLIIGDLNAYRSEDPITALESAGYTDLIEQFEGDSGYSYVFDGQLGYLDHALANASLAGQVTGTSGWTINADEVPVFDYNDDIADLGESAFERESTARELDRPDPRRSSDHDPVVIGLDLSSAPAVLPLTIDAAAILLPRGGPGTAIVAGGIDDTVAACPRIRLAIDGTSVVDTPTARLGRSTRCLGLGNGGVVTFDLARSTFTAVSSVPATFVLADSLVRFSLTIDGVDYGADVEGTRRGRVWTSR